jgi:phosphatidylserine decarboxylase
MSLLRTKNFGTMAYIEVGALGVGKIVQSHSAPILSVHPRKPKALEDLALKLFNIDFKKYLFLKRSKLRPKLSKNVPPSEPLPALTTDGAENNFKKGEEKGYFLFGGSTVIVCGEPGAWNISPDILKSTAKGFESYIKLGDTVAEPASGPR